MTAMVTIHGIRNCDTMKKARAWLDAAGIAYAFHDYKVQGIDRATLEGWVREVGWEALLNRAGTTFRKLPEADRQGLTEPRAILLMLGSPSAIRRPVLTIAGPRAGPGAGPAGGRAVLVGFDSGRYAAALAP